MAEFCLECWNALNGTNNPADKFVLSEELELCEGCGQQKQVIVTVRKSYRLEKTLERIMERIRSFKFFLHRQ